MNKVKSAGKIGLLFLTLAVVAILPLGFMQLKTARMINQVHGGTMSADEISGKQNNNELDVMEKLRIIAHGTEKSTSIITDYQMAEPSNDASIGSGTYGQLTAESSGLATKLTEQLKIVQELDVIPKFSTNGMIIRGSERIAYSDNLSNAFVNTIDMVAICDGANITARIDEETGVIYILIVMLKIGEKVNISALKPFVFMEYLGIENTMVNQKSGTDNSTIQFSSNNDKLFEYQYGVYQGRTPTIQYILVPRYNYETTNRQD